MAELSGKREAQQRVDRIYAFRRELDQLALEGALVLEGEQRLRLDAHLDLMLADLARRFDVDISDSQKKMSLAMRIASALGGLALCAAVFLFFYRYWGWLNTPTQVAILVAAPILCLIAAEWAAPREKTLYYTSLIVLVALTAFVLNLTVLGSIFNIAPTPNAFLAWGALAVILGYRHRLRLPLAGGLIALAIFVAAGAASLSGIHWSALVQRPETFLPGGLAMLAIPLLARHENRPGFPTVYRLLGLLAIFLVLLLLGNLGQLSFLPFSRKAAGGIYQTAEFATAIAAIWIGVRKRVPESVNLGSGFFAVYLFNRLYVWWWDWMPKYLFFLTLGIIALVLLAVFRRIRARGGMLEIA
jgi:uncharacterized membrane protein